VQVKLRLSTDGSYQVMKTPWSSRAHHPLIRLLVVSGVLRWFVYILFSVEGTPEGLPDKLYWRQARGEWGPGTRIYLTLPSPRNQLRTGAANPRPEAALRYSVCDGVEMKRRG
jgi:hypothetical protein